MIEAPAVLLIAWLLGGGREGGGPSKPGNGKKLPAGEPEVQELPDIGAWPRAVPKGGERPIKQTGGNDPIAWRRSRYKACVEFLSMDDRSIDALANLVASGAVEKDTFSINDIAISVVAHWDIETASGKNEYNYNLGGASAVPGQQYFVSTDVGDRTKPVAFCAYDSLVEGIADYFGVLSYERYASALVALLMLPTDPTWYSELGWSGYYCLRVDEATKDCLDAVEAEQAWSLRRAAVAVDVEGA